MSKSKCCKAEWRYAVTMDGIVCRECGKYCEKDEEQVVGYPKCNCALTEGMACSNCKYQNL